MHDLIQSDPLPHLLFMSLFMVALQVDRDELLVDAPEQLVHWGVDGRLREDGGGGNGLQQLGYYVQGETEEAGWVVSHGVGAEQLDQVLSYQVLETLTYCLHMSILTVLTAEYSVYK